MKVIRRYVVQWCDVAFVSGVCVYVCTVFNLLPFFSTFGVSRSEYSVPLLL